MNRLLTLIILAIAVATGVRAADNHSEGGVPSTPKRSVKLAPSYAWTALAPLGLHEPATIDTLMHNYFRGAIPSAGSDAWVTTGNFGAEGMNMIMDERPEMSDFFFRDAVQRWIPSLSTMKFYNTRIPMTLLSYNASGGRETAQERLNGVFSGNINAKAQVGAMIDYIYSKGSYANQADKDLIWGASGSYMGDRYEFQGYYNHFNLLNKENGGITDDLYITDPAELQGGVSSINPKSIPTRLNDAHSRTVGDDLFINNRYKVGYWHEEEINDTTVKRTYIPVSSFIWTLRFNQGRHVFTDGAPGETKEFFKHTYLNDRLTHDRTSYYTLTNTVGVSLLEGFHRYAKFGLAAYVTHQLRRYTQTVDTIDRTDDERVLDPMPFNIDPHATQNLAWVGAQLTKQRGSLLTYQATAQIGFLGPVAGDIEAEGRVQTRFRLLKDTLSVSAYGSFSNIEAPYLTKNYLSNHFIWKNDFGKRRTLKFGGSVSYPLTSTTISAGLENRQNHIYFNEEFMPVQHGGSVQVFTARLEQNFKVGILHWDNRVTYQTTSNDAVIPLPRLAVYSNLYLRFKIATLHVQAGIDCDYFTRYNGVIYQPATMTFANQTSQKVGNYPFMNAYINMKLSKARFYVLMSHVNQGLTGKNYFSMPGYPLNPRRFQIGISVDFAN